MNAKQLVSSIIEIIIKVVIAVFLIMFIYDAAGKAYDYGYRVFAEEPVTTGEGRTISIAVADGDSVKDIGENLQEKGLIRDANLFVVQEILSEHHGKIRPGIYDLNTSMKSDEMIAIMAAEQENLEDEENKASSDNVPIEEAGSQDDGLEEDADSEDTEEAE